MRVGGDPAVKLVRSWPAVIPEGRGYVVDDIPKLIMGADTPNYDYRCLADLDDDVVLIEWDIAVGGEQLRTFMDRAAAEPDRVRVAPYLLYRGGRDGKAQQTPFYVHRVRGPGARFWVKGPEDTHCHMFGFGLIYLPRRLVLEFLATDPGQFTDTTFSRWHMRKIKHMVPIDWDCHAIHLHYLLPEVPHGDVARHR